LPAVARDVERRGRLVEREGVADDRVDGKALGEQRQRLVEFVVEAEGADQVDLPGDHHVAEEAGFAGGQQAEQHDGSGAADAFHAAAQSRRRAGRLDRHVYIRRPRRVVRVVGADHRGRADLQGERQWTVQQVADDDLNGSGLAQGGDDEAADRPGTGDEHSLAGHVARAAHGVQRDGQRFGEDCPAQIQSEGQRPHLVGRDDEVLGEAA
jgi:hypothetical protein